MRFFSRLGVAKFPSKFNSPAIVEISGHWAISSMKGGG